jgi:ubiquinone/menaquinone biosynthesis C-methylase UbiE
VSEERFARAFGPVADEYERGRPGYPAAALDLLASELGLGGDSVVVDLAAGTGKLTRDLIPRFGRVIAVEPLEPMLAQLRLRAPAAEPLAGTAEEILLPDASADAVFAAQAFHWFDGERALREIARVLRPAGGLGLLWNTTPWEARVGPWFSALDDALQARRVDLSTLHRHASGRWRRAFDGDHSFEPLSRRDVENRVLLSGEDFVAGLASRSYIAVLDPGDRDELLAHVDSMLDRDDAPLEGGRVIVPMGTEVYWTRLREAGVG